MVQLVGPYNPATVNRPGAGSTGAEATVGFSIGTQQPSSSGTSATTTASGPRAFRSLVACPPATQFPAVPSVIYIQTSAGGCPNPPEFTPVCTTSWLASFKYSTRRLVTPKVTPQQVPKGQSPSGAGRGLPPGTSASPAAPPPAASLLPGLGTLAPPGAAAAPPVQPNVTATLPPTKLAVLQPPGKVQQPSPPSRGVQPAVPPGAATAAVRPPDAARPAGLAVPPPGPTMPPPPPPPLMPPQPTSFGAEQPPMQPTARCRLTSCSWGGTAIPSVEEPLMEVYACDSPVVPPPGMVPLNVDGGICSFGTPWRPAEVPPPQGSAWSYAQPAASPYGGSRPWRPAEVPPPQGSAWSYAQLPASPYGGSRLVAAARADGGAAGSPPGTAGTAPRCRPARPCELHIPGFTDGSHTAQVYICDEPVAPDRYLRVAAVAASACWPDSSPPRAQGAYYSPPRAGGGAY
jgi:hypothetical protein